MLLDDIGHAGSVDHVELLHLDPFADLVFEKVWFTAIGVIRHDDVLASVQKPSRRVQPDKAHPTNEQRWSRHKEIRLLRPRTKIRVGGACVPPPPYLRQYYKSSVLAAKISSICMTLGVRPCSCEYSATVSSTFLFDLTP